MLLKEAKEILKANGFILEGAYRDLIHQKIGEIRLNKKESEGRVAQSKRKAAKVLRTIYKECKVGNQCIIHAGAVIGADGFGFAPTADGYEKIPQIGIVVIEDNVEIGANTCIDRSTMGATHIGKGVKLDNLVQIAHNVEVGENTVMSSQTGVAGSSKVGKWCMFGGQVGIAGHIHVGDKTSIGAQSGVPGGNLARRGGAVMMGYPAVDHKTFARQSAALKSLPDMVVEFARMKEELKSLKEKIK